MVHLSPVNPVQHRRRIADWLRSEHVARWWGNPDQRLAQFDATPAGENAMIVQDDLPVGYVRWETIDTAALAEAGLVDIPAGSIDIDIFIGDPNQAGRGAGSAALALLFEHLERTTEAPLVGLCTSVKNHVAHRAFEKSGCSRIARFDDDVFGPCWVYGRRLQRIESVS